MTRRSARIFLPLLSVFAVGSLMIGCSEDDPAETAAIDEVVEIVPEGKTDNYYSTAAQEFTVTGRTTAVLDDDCLTENADAADPKQQCQLQSMGLKNFSIGFFLNQYTLDKHDSANEDWGGFTAMTRPESFESLAVEDIGADGTFGYTFTSELSGPLGLLNKLPSEPCADDASKRCFTLEIPVIDNKTLAKTELNDEWYREAPYKAYQPSSYTGDKETLSLTIEAYPRSNDAFLEYGKLFDPDQLAIAGGKLRVGLFVGWDYYDGRYDLQTAKELYRSLEARGFKSPVDSYDDLKIDSGDFTKTIIANGKEVDVEVQLVHPGQGDPDTAEFAGQMKTAMIEAFGTRQVIAYEGHAGPLYGFALGNWRMTEAGELDDSELPFMDVPSDFYQVVLASGCDTYMVADSLYAIPVKNGRKDLDVITTTSFSNAAGRGRTSKALLDAVTNDDGPDGGVSPVKYGELLRELNREYYFTPLYGVHGIDDNPRQNPFADTSVTCDPCSNHDDCGGFDNLCVNVAGAGRCASSCRTDDDCATTEICEQVATGDTIVSALCVPASLTCN